MRPSFDYLSLATVSERTGRPAELLRHWLVADPPIIPGRKIDGVWFIRSDKLELINSLPRKSWKQARPFAEAASEKADEATR